MATSTAEIQLIPRSTLTVLREILVGTPEKLPEYVFVSSTLTLSPEEPISTKHRHHTHHITTESTDNYSFFTRPLTRGSKGTYIATTITATINDSHEPCQCSHRLDNDCHKKCKQNLPFACSRQCTGHYCL